MDNTEVANISIAKELERKISIISKLERTNSREIINSILEKYIEQYTKDHKFVWSIFDKVETNTPEEKVNEIYNDWENLIKALCPWSDDEMTQKTIFEKWDNICFENAKQEQKEADARLTEKEKELSKQIRVDRSRPTFEEWKAQQEKKKTE